MRTVSILSHKDVAAELSILGEWLKEREFEVTRFYREDNWDPKEILKGDLVIVLGSPNSTASGYQHLTAEKEIRLVKSRLKADDPFFGICYGSQILSKALGAEVVRREVPNIGYKKVKSEEVDPGGWMLWHEDMVLAESLPDGAEVLATDSGAVIAFKFGKAIGVQFHPEVDGDALGRMISGIGIPEEKWGPIRDAMNADALAHRKRAFTLFDSLI